MSRHGHLSNTAAGEILAGLAGKKLKSAILGHLSRDCNSPELALETVGRVMGEAGGAINISCAAVSEAVCTLEGQGGLTAIW